MMNDVVLTNLFELSSAGELSRLRLVSKQWYQLSLPVWLKTGPPIHLNEDSLKHFVHQRRWRGPNKHSEIVGGIGRYPKFHLSCTTEYKKSVQNLFWKGCGPWLTHLTLRYSHIPGATRFLNILTCKFTPNLEALDVECRSFRNEKDDVVVARDLPMDAVQVEAEENRNLKEFRIDYLERSQLPMDWKTLLSHYPKLEHFFVGVGLSGTQSSQLEQILTAIQEIRNDDKDKLNLRSLTWFCNKSYRELHFKDNWSPLAPSVPKLLAQSALVQIETFRIDFSDGDSDELVNSILNTFSSSLKKLEFYRYPILQKNLVPFRNMDQLRVLTLSGYPVRNLLFLADLPNLRSLTLWGYFFHQNQCDQAAGTIISGTESPDEDLMMTFPALTQFRCNYFVKWTEADFRRLADLMPNLTLLEMVLNNFTFRLVCQYWPRLEHLTVYGEKVGDRGLVGLAKSGRKIIINEPNITNLRGLKSFAIDNLGMYMFVRESNLSEHSVLHGFLRLPALEQFVIKTHLMDTRIKELILRKIPVAKVITGAGACASPLWLHNV